MKNKLDKRFFDKHQVPELSAANFLYFLVDDALPDLFRGFIKTAKKKGLEMPDDSDERNQIMSMNDPETIVSYMRRINAVSNRYVMVQKVSEYAETAMPLVLKRYLTSALDDFIEIAAHCFVKNDLSYTIRLRERYFEIRNPYAQAVACLVFAMHGMHTEVDFLLEEYERMCNQYPKESHSDFPLLALHILCEK